MSLDVKILMIETEDKGYLTNSVPRTGREDDEGA
jgi:hypothetical protein